MTVGQLRGLAWGSGPALGWITFGGPILKKVEDKRADPANPTKREVELTWDNPIDYREVQVYRKKTSDPDFPSDPIKTFTDTDATKIQRGSDIKATVGGLDPNTNYQFFVRGVLRR
jgi:hypothetical protein